MSNEPIKETPSSDPSENAVDESESLGNAPEPSIQARVGRHLFNLLWVFLAPFTLAVGAVWLFAPARNEPDANPIRTFIGEQQIPAGILFFTIFAILIWRVRHHLPLSQWVGTGGRTDIPKEHREAFEGAMALLEEMNRITKTKAKAIEQALKPNDKRAVSKSIQSLQQSLIRKPFDANALEESLTQANDTLKKFLTPWRKGETREFIESIAVAVAVAAFLRTFGVEAFKIPSGSMIPTLAIGDHIFVNKFTYGPMIPGLESRWFAKLPPERGDVIVFKYPENMEQDFIKRTIALPGDSLEAIDSRPLINGWLVPQCYVGHTISEGQPRELYVEFLGDKSYLTQFAERPTQQTCSSDNDCDIGLSCRANVCGHLEGPFHVDNAQVYVMGDNRDNSADSRKWNNGRGRGVPFDNIKGRAMFIWVSFFPDTGISFSRFLINVMGRPQLTGAKDAKLSEGIQKCLNNRPPISDTTPPKP